MIGMVDTTQIAIIAENLKANGFTDNDTQVLMLAEEVGEFVGAYRRYVGKARRLGPFSDVEEELADVIIGALCVAEFLEIDINKSIQEKLTKIFTRGWRDNVNV